MFYTHYDVPGAHAGDATAPTKEELSGHMDCSGPSDYDVTPVGGLVVFFKTLMLILHLKAWSLVQTTGDILLLLQPGSCYRLHFALVCPRFHRDWHSPCGPGGDWHPAARHGGHLCTCEHHHRGEVCGDAPRGPERGSAWGQRWLQREECLRQGHPPRERLRGQQVGPTAGSSAVHISGEQSCWCHCAWFVSILLLPALS